MSLDNRIKIYNFLKSKKLVTTTSQDDWIAKWFANESKVNELYTFLNGNNKNNVKYYTNSLGDFYKKYCCDLFSNSQYCSNTPTPTPTPTLTPVPTDTTTATSIHPTQIDPTKVSPNFSCLLKNDRWGPALTKVDENHIMYAIVGYKGREFHFYSDNKFEYKDIAPFESVKGAWSCNGGANFVIRTEDDALFDSVTTKWSYHVSSQSSDSTQASNKPTAGSTAAQPTTTGAKKYLKIGDKGDLVNKLQNLLISKGFKNISKSGTPDGIFGARTKNAVIDFQTKNNLNPDGIAGPNTWEKLTGSRIISESDLIKKIVTKNLKSFIK